MYRKKYIKYVYRIQQFEPSKQIFIHHNIINRYNNKINNIFNYSILFYKSYSIIFKIFTTKI